MSGLCTATGIVPGLLLIWLGLRARRLKREIIEFSSWVKTYRRIRLADLAAKLGKSQMETEKLLAEVVDRGLVQGFVDRASDEFVVREAMMQGIFVGACPRCGGSVQRQFLLGETPICPYCRSGIGPPPPPAPPPFAGRQP